MILLARRYPITIFCAVLSCLLGLAGCQMAAPPRLATATAQAAMTPTATPEKLILPLAGHTAVAASTPTPAAGQAEPNPALSVWVNETSPAHQAALQAMAAEFTAASQVDVALMFVAPSLLPDLVNTAVLSGTLPDIIIHPLVYTPGWVERGILNPAAADTAVTEIGRDTFDPEALALVAGDNQITALPSDGARQLLVYRTDWFEQNNLAPPDDYAAMLAAAEATTDRENLRAGFVIPTESNLVSTHQAFEQIALANGCELIDEKGEVLLPQPSCREALAFYYSIVHQFSPIGVQTDTSTHNAYLAGRTGLIMVSPAILPQLAGLDPASPPVCPQCLANPTFLAQNSGIITEIQGRGPMAVPAGFSTITNLGITTAADADTAVAFAHYWFNDGYEKWLAVNAERKVPLRRGTGSQPTRFLAAWGTLPLHGSSQSLSDIYGPDVVAQLRDGVAAAPRWGIRQGQGRLVTELIENLTLSVTWQEMLSGYFNPEQTILEATNRVIGFIPNYQYDLEEAEPETDEE